MILPETAETLAKLIDQALLHPGATSADVRALCTQALELGYRAVCVNGSRVLEAYHALADSDVKVCSVIGFPLGASDPGVKLLEAETALDHGAQEFDVVINVGRLKDGDDQAVLRELRGVVEAVDELPVKVILEMSLLTPDEVKRGCRLVIESGAQWVKSSTGFGQPAVTPAEVRALRAWVGPDFGVKAAGGIRDLLSARRLIEAGASRLGTSSGADLIRAFRQAGSIWPADASQEA
jgi:deoxyribose-phosphate aldolase